ncbi:MAG: reverse transcriptase [Candidatus Cryptobacteroides sp.]
MTKKVGYILEKIADKENLHLAVKNSQRGGKAKRRKQIRDFNKDAENQIDILHKMILSLNFPPHNSRKLTRKADKGKIRNLDDEDYMPWKIMSHAIMQIIEPIVNKSLIADTSCCIKGRGCLYGVKRVKRILRRYPYYTWFSQSDCKKYYQSIDPDYLERALRHKFKDDKFIKLMKICVLDYDSGDEIEKALVDERAKKERCTNWCIHQRNDRQPQPQRD